MNRLDYTISNDEITIPDYALFRKDRLMSGGGVAVYIRNVLNSDRAKDVPLNLEAVCVEIVKSEAIITTVYIDHLVLALEYAFKGLVVCQHGKM